jgi:two-component system, NtrC family, sensor kinase
VAHEINNPLTGVLTYTHMLLKAKRSERGRASGFADHCGGHGTGQKNRERAPGFFPADRAGQGKGGCQLPGAFHHCAHGKSGPGQRGQDVKFNPGENLSPVNMDRSQFQSVLLNILINGLDATKSGEGITVTTKNSDWVNEAGQEGSGNIHNRHRLRHTA